MPVATPSKRMWSWDSKPIIVEYGMPARVLKMMGVTQVKLMTNNPDKVFRA